VRRRVFYELDEMSDFIYYYLETVREANKSETLRTIDFIKGEIKKRKR
jgi:hypothetical protein